LNFTDILKTKLLEAYLREKDKEITLKPTVEISEYIETNIRVACKTAESGDMSYFYADKWSKNETKK